jgi:multiple sugar transport system substrate-binding protein
MQRKSFKFLIFLWCTIPPAILATVLTGLCGCGGASTISDGKAKAPFTGNLRVACPGVGPAGALLRRYGQAWTLHQGGGQVEVVTYDRTLGPPAAGASDIWVIEPAELGRWAATGELLPVPDAFRQGEGHGWSQLLPLYHDRLLAWESTTYATPIFGEAPLCYFRKDLFADPGHRTAFKDKYHYDLGAPATWEEYKEIAAYFCEHGPEGKAAPSLPPLPDQDAELDYLFYAVASPFARKAVREVQQEGPGATDFFSFHYDLATGQPRLANPGFIHALRLLQRLQPYRAPSAAEPPRSFRDGQAVLCLAPAAWLEIFQQGDAKVLGKFDVCAVPGSTCVFDYHTGVRQDVPGGQRMPYLGSSGLIGVVPRQSAQAEAAWDLLGEICSRDNLWRTALDPKWGGGVMRRDQFGEHAKWHSFTHGAELTEKMLDALQTTLVHPGVSNPVLCLRIPDQLEHQAALDVEIRAALMQGKDAEVALKDAVARWEQIDQRQNPEKRMAEYARSLGLHSP